MGVCADVEVKEQLEGFFPSTVWVGPGNWTAAIILHLTL